MKKRIGIFFKKSKESLKRIVKTPSRGEQIKNHELILLEKELKPYPENQEKYLILRKEIIRVWLTKHSKNGKILAKERDIQICYNNCCLCPLGIRREGCEFCRKFYGYYFCFVYLKKD